MEYLKYQHVEKLGTSEVQGILCGTVYVFPKIDGTNAHVWGDAEGVHYGSRTRELGLDNDNAGFMAAAIRNKGLTNFCTDNPHCHLFGEWLVPHSLKTYCDSAWRRFYVFDVVEEDADGNPKHWHYDRLSCVLDKYGIEYIVPQRILINPSVEHCIRETEDNKWLVTEGTGEGVVLKNYEFVNKFGRQTWAKVVTSDFKHKHHKEMGAPVTRCTKLVEQEASELLSDDIVEKVYASIVVAEDGWSSKLIPRLLETVWHDFVVECSYEMVKKWKLPTINYRTLKAFVTQRIKAIKPELF